MISLDVVRVAILIAVTLAYALFDVFNKREVPDLFVYGTLALGAIMLFTYGNEFEIVSGACIAGIVGLLGFFLYREGWLGAGDFLEFVFISLAMPFQAIPLLINVQQFSLPFVFSVFIGAGYSVSIFVPVYYLLFVRRGREEARMANMKPRYIQGLSVFFLYIALLVVAQYLGLYTITGTALVLLLAVPSTIIWIYEKQIYMRMVAFIYPKELEYGDMIAVNLMDKRDVEFYRKKSKLFGRLASGKLISSIKDGKVKIPVYRNSVPFALFIFVGVVLSILIGNLILIILA